MLRRFAGLLPGLLLPLMAWGGNGELLGVRLSDSADATRVVLDLSKPLAHRIFTLRNPDRVVIDLPGGEMQSGARIDDARGLVANVRTGKHGQDDLRIVLDLTASAQPRSFVAAPDGDRGHRLVVDLGRPREEGLRMMMPCS